MQNTTILPLLTCEQPKQTIFLCLLWLCSLFLHLFKHAVHTVFFCYFWLPLPDQFIRIRCLYLRFENADLILEAVINALFFFEIERRFRVRDTSVLE